MFRTILAALVLTLPMTACAEDPAVTETPSAKVVVTFDADTITPLIVEGVRNFESREAVQANDPVRVASVSKLIMALATLRLVEEGKVDLDADVSDYLGWQVRSLNYPDVPITLRQLLSHRAGLRDAAGYIVPLGESLEAKLSEPDAWYSDAPPGEAPFQYANLGSPIVVTALEAASGERYDKLLNRLVFEPLKIEACVNWIDCSGDMVSRAVALYRHTGEEARDWPADLPPNCSFPVADGVECSLKNYKPGTNGSVFSPQGGVRIGMMDLAKIGQALIAEQGGERLLGTAMIAELLGSIPNEPYADQQLFCLYGMHLHAIPARDAECLDDLFEGSSATWLGHSGEAYGLQSGLWVDPTTGEGIAYFHTQVPPPVGGEDTGGFTQGQKDLMKRAAKVAKALAAKQQGD